LQESLSDPAGKLVVDERGPNWNGKEKLTGLSYSNTEGWGVLVFSKTHELGVDLEKETRVLKKNYLELAKRFFHSTEVEWLEREAVFDGPVCFLDLWMKKEAYSKMKRQHLVDFIGASIAQKAVFEPLMKTRVGYKAIIALPND